MWCSNYKNLRNSKTMQKTFWSHFIALLYLLSWHKSLVYTCFIYILCDESIEEVGEEYSSAKYTVRN